MFAGIWLLIIAITLICLSVASIKNIFSFAESKERRYLFLAIKPWFFLLVPLGVITFLLWYSDSVPPIDRANIRGDYEVDSRFYPGENSAWQKAHYRFTITNEDKFILYERLADNSEKEYTGSIKWANENPEKWSIQMIDSHHIVDPHPVLYRNHKKFHYVFRTKYFGNMFFCKIEK